MTEMTETTDQPKPPKPADHHLHEPFRVYRPSSQAIKRNCLCCKKPFTADGKFNRLCVKCRSNNTYRSGFDV